VEISLRGERGTYGRVSIVSVGKLVSWSLRQVQVTIVAGSRDESGPRHNKVFMLAHAPHAKADVSAEQIACGRCGFKWLLSAVNCMPRALYHY